MGPRLATGLGLKTGPPAGGFGILIGGTMGPRFLMGPRLVLGPSLVTGPSLVMGSLFCCGA